MTGNGTSKQPLVIFMPSGRRGRVLAGTAVLEAARQLGEPVESICGGHLTCRKCRVRLEEGDFLKHGIISQQSHLSSIHTEEQAAITRLHISGDRLSCQAQILGDVLISVPEVSRGHKQIIRKSATARIIDIDPAVRQVYVIVAQAELGEHHSDWERLQAVLAREWQVAPTGAPVGIDLPALRQLQPALREGKRAITVTFWQEREVTPNPGWGSLRGILVHTLDAEYGWRSALQGQDDEGVLEAANFADVAALKTCWEIERAAWFDYAAGLSEERVNQEYGDDPQQGPKVWQTILHVVTHSIQHRSEAAAILTDYGCSPGELDFDLFLYERPDPTQE